MTDASSRLPPPVRRALGIRTAFNYLGPIVNPARVRRQVIGVSDEHAALRIAEVVRDLVDGKTGPVRDAVVLNAGAALAVYAARSGDPIDRLRGGIAEAERALDSGAARTALDRWVSASTAA